MVCRAVEQAGIATVCYSTGRDLTAQVKPPRSLFVNFPMGNNFGGPGDIATQNRILQRGLELLAEVQEGGTLVDWHEQWPEPVVYFTGKR